MSPGVPPVVAWTPPIGLRYTRKPIAGVSLIHNGCLQLKRRASRGRGARLRRAHKTGALRAKRPAASLQVVELTGIEPVASWLQTRRSPR